MQQSHERILTTHVGSLPRPDGLAELLTALDRDTLSDADRVELPAKVRTAVADTVKRQVEAGIDVVDDGEMSKFGYATYVKQRLSGFEGENEPLALSEFADFPTFTMKTALEVTNPACTGPVSFHGEQAVASDIANLKAALEQSPAVEGFMNAASPGIIVDYLINHHYEDEQTYLYAVADAMRHEYKAIVDAGFVLQLDCPDLALGRHFVPQPMEIGDFREKITHRIEAINHALRDLPADRIRMHICWGNYESPHHHDVPLSEIVDIILSAHPAGLLVEAANPRHEHEWRVFEDVSLPEGKVLIPGVIDTLTSYIEHPEVVAQRIVRYAQVVGRENVIAGTDCGFATFANFTPLNPEIAWAKLRALSDGAALASRELWSSAGVAPAGASA
ncbi:MAG TPA: cobalamin-independent methionine synthase II family protein [Solirubrobacteraceae bacterium]|jgi:5-methyltetrahydropteroyltriglutamate--homocysteine methyltransferase|nr:cobalamin-independent methionine synthase II family protein [Solirubrobacteraceae bacterium]